LKQIRRADRLEFASWGGFAQNFAGRRIPFEHPAYAAYWESLATEYLRIPTFVSSGAGPYLPGSAIKGALRTALVSGRFGGSILKDLAVRSKDRAPRSPGEAAEARILGNSGQSRMKVIGVSDSSPVSPGSLKIFLLRVATLERGAGGKFQLRWKLSPRGSVEGDRPQRSTPVFAEMATPGTAFEGVWQQRSFYQRPEVVRALRWKEPLTTRTLLAEANAWAARVLASHKVYARVAGLAAVENNIQELETRLAAASQRENACLLSVGWGGGFLTKSGGPDPREESYRELLRQFSFFSKAIRTGLPFPKTRRIVFLEDQPGALPGWALLEIL